MKRNIIIFGGTGFIGYHLIKRLAKRNFNIVSISKSKPRKNRKIKNVKYLNIDVTLKKNLNSIFKKKYDYVFNLAGYVDHSKKILTLNTHYIFVRKLIKTLKNKKIKKFVQIGSSLEYADNKSPHKENLKLSRENFNSFYSLSKFLSTEFLTNQKLDNKINYLVVRPYLIYGPNQDENRIIPFVINKCIKNQKFDTSSGNQIRNFLYIDDFIDGLIELTFNNKINNQIVNIGSYKNYKIKTIIKKIIKLCEKGKPNFGKIKLRKDENLISYPNLEKIKKLIKWSPNYQIDRGLIKTINYYKKNF